MTARTPPPLTGLRLSPLETGASDETTPQTPDTPGAAFIESLSPALLSVGEQLRAAREGRGLTVVDVAKMLKLSPSQVEALELDDWKGLPKTIIRGFVRNYARALHLDADALMAALDAAAMPASPELRISSGTKVRVPVERDLLRRDYLRVFAGVGVLALALIAYFFIPQDLVRTGWQALKASLSTIATNSEQDAVTPPAAPRAAGEPTLTMPLAAPDNAPGNPPPTSAEASPGTAPGVAPPALDRPSGTPGAPGLPSASPAPAPLTPGATPPPANATSPAAGHALKFSFRQPSWVEVRDRSGQIIFSQLCQAGTQREIEGKPPFTLVIGNAAQVSLSYNGKPVDLSRRSRDEVARVTVE